MKKRYLAVVALAAILIIALLVVWFIPKNRNTLSIQFYDKDRNPVGAPRGFLAPVLIDNVEVTFFAVTVSWFTDNPEVKTVSWQVNLKVAYQVSERGEQVIFDDVCWGGADVANPQEGSLTSPLYAVEAYATYGNGIPEDTAFWLWFYGFAKFGISGTPLVEVQVDLVPVQVNCFHSHYTYTATVGIGW